MISLKVYENGIEKRLNNLISKITDLRPILNGPVYKTYQNIQRERWMTENSSQSSRWDRLNPEYAKRKLIKFAKYPGAGSKMLIATGRLYQGVIGPSSEHRKLVEPKRLYIATTVPYAKYVNEKRDFVTFDSESINQMKKLVSDYLNDSSLEVR